MRLWSIYGSSLIYEYAESGGHGLGQSANAICGNETVSSYQSYTFYMELVGSRRVLSLF